jgi:outer membrane protein, heavy metal efflux system
MGERRQPCGGDTPPARAGAVGMQSVRQRSRFAVLLLPVTLAACAHQYADLAPSDAPSTPAPSVRAMPGAGLTAAPQVPDADPEPPSIRLASRNEAGSEKPMPPCARLVSGRLESEVGGQRSEVTTADHSPLTSPDKHGLTLAELEQMAFESNPSLMQLAAVVDKARGIHEQVGLYPNPSVGYSASEIGNEGRAGQQGGYIGQTIVTAGKLRLNRDVASWNIQELSWEYQAQRLRVQNDVRRRYYDVIGVERRIKIAADLLKVAETGAKIAEQLFKAKQASKADVLQAQIDLNHVRIIQQNAQIAYAAYWRRLTAVLGRPRMSRQTLAGTLSGDVPSWEWEPAWEKLVGSSPQLQAARSRVQRARMEIQRQEAQPIPNLNTQLAVQQDANSGYTIAGVQIGVPLPVFNRNQGNIRVAQAEYQRTFRDVQRLELQLRDALATAFRNFQQAKYQVARYEKGILDNARESLKLTEQSYEARQVSFLRVLTARRTYFEANLQYVQALIALRQASVVIDGYVLTGGLTDVPDIASRPFSGLGQRGQALSGQ